MRLLPTQYFRVYTVNFKDRKSHRWIFKLRYENIASINHNVMLYYNVWPKALAVYTVNFGPLNPVHFISTGTPALYGSMVSRWRNRWRKHAATAQSMLQCRKSFTFTPPPMLHRSVQAPATPKGGNRGSSYIEYPFGFLWPNTPKTPLATNATNSPQSP